MVVRWIILLITSVFFIAVSAQSEFEKKHVIRASATFGIGSMQQDKQTNLLLPTSLEYYLDERISIRNDAVFFLGHENETYFGFLMNHAIYSGISYHFTKNKLFDPYFGLQTGMALVQYGVVGDDSEYIVDQNAPYEYFWLKENNHAETTINGLISPHVGLNYYAKNYFHLFMDLRYIYGNYHSNIPKKSLEELRFEFGLGFNLGLAKYLNKK